MLLGEAAEAFSAIANIRVVAAELIRQYSMILNSSRPWARGATNSCFLDSRCDGVRRETTLVICESLPALNDSAQFRGQFIVSAAVKTGTKDADEPRKWHLRMCTIWIVWMLSVQGHDNDSSRQTVEQLVRLHGQFWQRVAARNLVVITGVAWGR